MTKKFDHSRTLSMLGKKTWPPRPKPNQPLPPFPLPPSPSPLPPPLKFNVQQPKFKLD